MLPQHVRRHLKELLQGDVAGTRSSEITAKGQRGAADVFESDNDTEQQDDSDARPSLSFTFLAGHIHSQRPFLVALLRVFALEEDAGSDARHFSPLGSTGRKIGMRRYTARRSK
ncbi:hypothetical protein HPB50_024023 [Hyalomma asiaticum]|uniref:Uncharacterized protein n=1 Tax=Hyalomma asiaticum TaxID=266040 RepID=A0ACB7SYI2_HYAAI|nr:hypothetical protein HPB50_024023 [Hyalomma asiaticum]